MPLHLGLKLHTQTRSKKLISEMYHLGISVSYDRILELENQIATALCNSTDEIGLVCPASWFIYCWCTGQFRPQSIKYNF